MKPGVFRDKCRRRLEGCAVVRAWGLRHEARGVRYVPPRQFPGWANPRRTIDAKDDAKAGTRTPQMLPCPAPGLVPCACAWLCVCVPASALAAPATFSPGLGTYPTASLPPPHTACGTVGR